jgi:hypothetical protein
VNFFSAYYDDDERLIVDWKVIFLSYFWSWFAIDLVSVIPFSMLFEFEANYNTLARLGRLPKLYKIVRMTRFMRLVKALKEKNAALR